MITEFTCGIFAAILPPLCTKWSLRIENTQIALIFDDGSTISFSESPLTLKESELIEIAVLMNNIKRQYKQLQTT